MRQRPWQSLCGKWWNSRSDWPFYCNGLRWLGLVAGRKSVTNGFITYTNVRVTPCNYRWAWLPEATKAAELAQESLAACVPSVS